MNKRQRALLQQHKLSSDRELWDCYKQPSREKLEAYKKCYSEYIEKKGRDFKIMGFNTYGFSIGYKYDKNGVSFFHYETSKNSYEFTIN